jgi:hypothetical protein
LVPGDTQLVGFQRRTLRLRSAITTSESQLRCPILQFEPQFGRFEIRPAGFYPVLNRLDVFDGHGFGQHPTRPIKDHEFSWYLLACHRVTPIENRSPDRLRLDGIASTIDSNGRAQERPGQILKIESSP